MWANASASWLRLEFSTQTKRRRFLSVTPCRPRRIFCSKQTRVRKFRGLRRAPSSTRPLHCTSNMHYDIVVASCHRNVEWLSSHTREVVLSSRIDVAPKPAPNAALTPFRALRHRQLHLRAENRWLPLAGLHRERPVRSGPPHVRTCRQVVEVSRTL